jgi:hypothetical protein
MSAGSDGRNSFMKFVPVCHETHKTFSPNFNRRRDRTDGRRVLTNHAGTASKIVGVARVYSQYAAFAWRLKP